MTEVETELDSRYDNIDVESILARCQKSVPLTFTAATRCLYQAPEFIRRLPATEEVEEGSTVTFSCKVAGFPEPDIAWYKDDAVIDEDSRASLDYGELGVHSITFKDISKCDAGIYKIQATNLEGSSKSMLYISVKGKSKTRHRKRGKKSRPISSPPIFPAIIERDAEERKETLAAELQPESPLTPLYCTISRKAPVIWPAFLGEWAFNKQDDVLHKDDLDDIKFIDDDEDVFEDEECVTISPYNLTFVSKAYAELKDDTDLFTPISKCHETSKETGIKTSKQTSEVNNLEAVDRVKTSVNAVNVEPKLETDANTVKSQQEDHQGGKVIQAKGDNKTTYNVNSHTNDSNSVEDSNKTSCVLGNTEQVCDKLNNNTKSDKDRNETEKGIVKVDHKTENRDSAFNTPQESDTRVRICDPETVSVICVHRSYAKGATTASVARRSPSPFSGSQNMITFTNPSTGNNYDTPTMQNLNNERILQNLSRQGSISERTLDFCRSAFLGVTWEDLFLEMILFICASTFLALCFELSPTTFVIDILIALFVKFVLTDVFQDI